MSRRPNPKGHQNRIAPNDISLQVLTPIEQIISKAIIDDQEEKIVKKQQLEHDYFTAYKPANYKRALKFKRDHSYQEKNPDGTHVTF